MAPIFRSPNLEIVNKWVMVPKGDFRLVELQNAGGMKLEPSTKGAVQILELTGSRVRASKQRSADIVDRLCPVYTDGNEKECSDLKTDARKRLTRIAFRLKKQVGNTRILVIIGKKEDQFGKIRVLKNKKEVAHLYVSVAKPLTVRVGLFIIRHQPGGQKTYVPHSSITSKQLTKAVDFASAIWRQGGIELAVDQIGTADVAEDLGTVIDVRKDTQQIKNIRSTKSRLKFPCIFVAKEIINDSHSSGKTFDNLDVFIDNKYKDKYLGRLIAHEFCHVFSGGGVDRQHPDPTVRPNQDSKGNPLPLLFGVQINKGPLNIGMRQNPVYDWRKRAEKLSKL